MLQLSNLTPTVYILKLILQPFSTTLSFSHQFLISIYTVSSTMNSMACCGDWLVSTMVISLPSMVIVGTVMP